MQHNTCIYSRLELWKNAPDYAHTGIKPEVISGSGIIDTKLTSISVNK